MEESRRQQVVKMSSCWKPSDILCSRFLGTTGVRVVGVVLLEVSTTAIAMPRSTLYCHWTEKHVAVKMWRLPQDEEEKNDKLAQLSKEVAHLQTLVGDVSVKIYAFKDKVDFDWFEAAL